MTRAFSALALALAGALAAPIFAQSAALKSNQDRLSYSVGVNIGRNLKQQSLDVNPEQVAAGLKDALAGAPLKLTDQEMMQAIIAYQQEFKTKQAAAGDKNKAAGEKFLNANAKKPGVHALPSGLQYKIIKQGTGPKPKPQDVVKTNYRGTLIDGTEFDSSYKSGKPIVFPVGQVIKGWTEALQMMPVGSKWQLFIPPQLAYGPEGKGPIGPQSTLVFEVELLGIVPAGAAEQN